MSIQSSATLNIPLTSFAQGFMQDRLASYTLANLLCPIVNTNGVATGTYKKFDGAEAFRIQPTKRAIGGPRLRLAHAATDGTYNCRPHGLEIGTDDFEADLVGIQGAVAAELLDQGKIKTLLAQKANSYAKRVVDFVVANCTAVTDRGNFSNQAIDPIQQIDESLDALSLVAGTSENISVVMGVSVWRAIRDNAKVKARLGITGGLALKREQLVDGLLFPVNLVVSASAITTAKEGQATSTKARLTDGYVFMLISQPNPTIDDISPFKCFSTQPVLVDSVKDYRDETSNSTIHAVDWSEDIQSTGSACIKMFAVT